MFLRTAAMTTAVTLSGAAFVAGAAAGLGLGLASVGAACLARRAMKRRGKWGKDEHEEIVASLAANDEPHPGSAPA
jgi:TctA family transporter